MLPFCMMKTDLAVRKSKLECVVQLRHRQLRRIWLLRRKRKHKSGNLSNGEVKEESDESFK